jgi:hypothetical protein
MENKMPAGLSASRLEKLFCKLGGFLLLAVAVNLLDGSPDGTRESRHGPIGYRAAHARIIFTRQIHQVR